MPVADIVGQIEQLTVLELNELVKTLEDKFGVSAAAAPVAMAAAVAGDAPAEEVKDSFDIVLTSFGEKKIQVIKVVRVITGLGLKEAKELVDGVPGTVKEGATKEEGEEIQKQIEAAGGTIELK
jgi:large subunit ribosomal protein L7/L12